MRAVLDTNVLVSGLLSPGGTCSRILGMLEYDEFEACLDRRILQEYEVVLSRAKLKIDPERAEEILDLMRELCGECPAGVWASAVPDESDRPFLEVASAENAVLVTGNVKHFPPRARSGVTVLTPAEFLAQLRPWG